MQAQADLIELSLTPNTLASEITQTDANALKFNHVYNQETDDETLKGLITVMKALPKLHTIDLDLEKSNKDITEEGLIAFCQDLKQFSGLQSIAIKCQGKSAATDEALKTLKATLEGFSALKSLSLDFSCSEAFTDESVNIVTQAFQGLSSLEFLDINFGRIPNLTNQALKSLGENIKSLKNVNKVQICFDRCNLTDEALKSLGEGLQTLAALKFVLLDFGRVQGLSGEAFKELREVLEKAGIPEIYC